MQGGKLSRLGWRLASPTGIALSYLVFGLIWIFTSDRILESYATGTLTITDLQTYKGWAYVSVTAVMLYGLAVTMAARLGAAHSRLGEMRANFGRLVESSNDGMYLVDAAGRVLEVNSRLTQILGVPKEQLLGDGISRFLEPAPPESTDPGAPEEIKIVRFARGDRATGWVGWGIISSVPLLDARGGTSGTVWLLTDITRTRCAEDALRASLNAERTLLSELDHRVRNNLSSLLTLIEMTKRSAASVDEFASLIRGRVGAMAATHSLLAESKFETVDLQRLIGVIAEAEQGHRLQTGGGAVMLAPRQAGPMAMILQELWTNSRKHGALTTQHGRVEVRWEVVPARDEAPALFRLDWCDRDGPPASTPDQFGFGLSLVTGLVTSDLHGRFSSDFTPQGAVFSLEFPMRCPAGSTELSPARAVTTRA